MPTSTDINLPKDQVPVWPDRCVCCRAESPGHRTKFWTFAIGWWTIVFLSYGGIFVARVPACKSCARKLQWGRAVRWILWAIIAGAAAIGAVWILRHYNGPMRIYLGVGIACLATLPLFFLEAMFPPAFDMTSYAKTVDYEFRDDMYAAEFEMLNMQTDKVDVLNEDI